MINNTDRIINPIIGNKKINPNKKDIYSMNKNYDIYKFPLIKCFTLKEAFKNVLYRLILDEIMKLQQ